MPDRASYLRLGKAVTGKLIVDSFDVEGRVGYHMHPSRQNQPEGMRQMEFAVWMLERCTDLMGPGVEYGMPSRPTGLHTLKQRSIAGP